MPIRYALSNNIGLGGHNGAIIFKRYDGGLSARATIRGLATIRHPPPA